MARDVVSTKWAMRTAVVVSILAHAAVISASGLRRERAAEADPPPAADQWSGNTSMPVGGELHEVDLAGGQPGPTVPPSPQTAPAAPAAPAPEPAAPAPEPAVAPVAKSAKEDVGPAEPVKPVVKADKPKKPRNKTPAAPDSAKAKQDPADDTNDKATGGEDAARDKRDAQSGGPAGPGGGSFGSEGPSSVRDLGAAFMRGIPAACAADATWGTLSTGSAGRVEVAILVGEDGRITGWEPLEPNPPAHLAAIVKRTLPLIRGGTFAIQKGAVSAGRQVLRLSVALSDTDEAEKLGKTEWDGRKGIAYFIQPGGRRVDVKVELVRVEPG